jgi:hypothetical protein
MSPATRHLARDLKLLQTRLCSGAVPVDLFPTPHVECVTVSTAGPLIARAGPGSGGPAPTVRIPVSVVGSTTVMVSDAAWMRARPPVASPGCRQNPCSSRIAREPSTAHQPKIPAHALLRWTSPPPERGSPPGKARAPLGEAPGGGVRGDHAAAYSSQPDHVKVVAVPRSTTMQGAHAAPPPPPH